MNLYAEVSFYTNEYLEGRAAVIEPNCLLSYLRKAQRVLKTFTFDNIDESAAIPYEVKMCVCEIAEILFREDKRDIDRGGVTSESVVGWTKSYESSEQAEKNKQKRIKDCVFMWLSDTGLLYCGVTV